MSKIFITVSLIFITFTNVAQVIIKHLPVTINTIGSELNFLQLNEESALYTSSTLEGEKYQSLIFKTELKNGSWERGRYFHLTDAYSVGNIACANNDTVFYFSVCDEFDNCKIAKKYYKNSNAKVLKNKINAPNVKNTQPHKTIFEKNHILYFVSNRKGGSGGLDIWFSVIDKNGNYGQPINAGNKINSPSDEITPFYNIWTGELFFSSNRGKEKTGFDIYKSLGSLNYWGDLKEVRELNSENDDLYLSFYNKYNGYFASNRSPSIIKDDKNCCNDIFSFEYPKADSVIISFNDTIKEHLPIKLYFHNDDPERQTIKTITIQTYKDSYVSYYLKKEEYLRINDPWEREEIDLFFEKKLKGNYNKLHNVLEYILQSLKGGKKIILHVKGFSSPLYNAKYNTNLSKRRISSCINMITTFKNGELKRYLQSGGLEIIQLPFGENNSKESVSDNPKDIKKSIYSIGAMLERKIEIVEIIEL